MPKRTPHPSGIAKPLIVSFLLSAEIFTTSLPFDHHGYQLFVPYVLSWRIRRGAMIFFGRGCGLGLGLWCCVRGRDRACVGLRGGSHTFESACGRDRKVLWLSRRLVDLRRLHVR